jgi:hypothetical protein
MGGQERTGLFLSQKRSQVEKRDKKRTTVLPTIRSDLIYNKRKLKNLVSPCLLTSTDVQNKFILIQSGVKVETKLKPNGNTHQGFG